MTDIKYTITKDIGNYLNDAIDLIISGGQWSNKSYVENIIISAEYVALATHNKKLVGIFLAKNKLKFKDITYCIGGLLSVNEEYRNKSVGYNLIKTRDNLSKIDLFIATINPKNKISIKTFLKSKYKYHNDLYYSKNFYERLYYKSISNKDSLNIKIILDNIINK